MQVRQAGPRIVHEDPRVRDALAQLPSPRLQQSGALCQSQRSTVVHSLPFRARHRSACENCLLARIVEPPDDMAARGFDRRCGWDAQLRVHPHVMYDMLADGSISCH
jgi:hypothetical protein